MPVLILENIRSAYNVGNMIRTADAFGFEIIISGYTPHPNTDQKVQKTSLGAEKQIKIHDFWNPLDAIKWAKTHNYYILAGEINPQAMFINIFINYYLEKIYSTSKQDIACILGNEVTGIMPESLANSNQIVSIPMLGTKESLNVSQAAAIFMWEINKILYS